jgi:hypothetical protein
VSRAPNKTPCCIEPTRNCRSETGDIAGDLLKGVAKDAFKLGTAHVLFSIATWFSRNGKEKKVKAIEWLGSAIAKLAGILDKQPKAHSIKTVDVTTDGQRELHWSTNRI